MGTHAEKHGWPLAAGKSKEIDFPLEPPEGIQSYQHYDFTLMKLISHLLSLELKVTNLCYLN